MNAWVRHWKELLNKSQKQTISDLQEFLAEKGLLSNQLGPTELALRLGFARWIDGRVHWNLQKYIRMKQADKKVRKLLQQKKPIHPNKYKRALWATEQ